MSASLIRRAGASAAVAAALLGTACVAPLPGTTTSWVVSPNAAAFAPAYSDELTTRYDLVSVTEPAWVSCTRAGVDGPLAAACESHYEGAGFVVRVPDACQTAIRGTAAPASVPRLRLQVDGVAHEIEPFPLNVGGSPLATDAVRSAIYVTVSGRGVLTSGFYTTGPIPMDARRVEETPRAPLQDAYAVRLSCADGAGSEPGTWSVTTYEGTVTPS